MSCGIFHGISHLLLSVVSESDCDVCPTREGLWEKKSLAQKSLFIQVTDIIYVAALKN
jgi:hypothetical protein